jgi:hypothetical protein
MTTSIWRIRSAGENRVAVWSAALAALFLMPAALSGQWLSYPTPGIPRNADGSPNLDAPAPRTVEGRPDLGGIWRPERNQKCPPDGCPDNQMSEQFLDLGWGLKGGLPYQPWAAALVKERSGQNGKDDPTSHCFPGGIVRLHNYPAFNKIIQTPVLIVILSEREVTYRQIFMDGRPLPVDPLPTWKGYSVGRWDGDTLVVESSGFRSEGIWLDRKGSPLTEAATITERFRRISYGRMEVEITVNDPKAYTAPFTVTLNEYVAPDTELLDFVCLENNKDAPHLIGK